MQVRTREDGYLLVLQVGPDGHLRVLFPLDPSDDNFARGGVKYDVRGRGGRESFTVDNVRGRGTVYAAVSHDPFKFDQFVLGDHWDYRNLDPQRLSSDPEQELNELVRRMVDNSFDYDILTYDVLERVVYASEYNSDYYGYSDGCGYSYYCGHLYYGSPYSLSIGLFFGQPYYGFYSPYYPIYSPYYSAYSPYYPYYYRPYYYRPYYYRPYYSAFYPGYYPGYPVPYGGYYYGHSYGGSYGNRFYGNWNQPYTPYRFRGADAPFGNYQTRGFGVRRAVNTVYTPPVVRGREPTSANVGRRVTDPQPVGAARPSVDGRTRAPAGDARRASASGQGRPAEPSGGRRVENRVAQPNIDARRARQPEQVRSIIPDSRNRAGGRNMPTEIRPSRSEATPRRAVERPQEVIGREARAPQEIEARPARRDDGGSLDRGRSDMGFARPDNGTDRQPDTRRSDQSGEMSGVHRPESRGPDRGGDWGGGRGGDRGSYSPPARSAPSSPDGGGMRGYGGGGPGGGGGGGGGGGFRRR